ncbi:MAG: type II secretion system GspH family protein [Burkholderiales bacterium]|nr:type II secretion system GspH family protein [Burkholderiales bacterium]
MSRIDFRAVASNPRCRGASLVEVILFIVVVGIAAGGILMVFANTTRASADPLIRKQALAIAESLLEEIRLMPFTFCDPDDARVATATGAFVGPAGCAATVEALGPEAGETRYAALTPFDNVNDYNGFAMAGGILDITGAPIAGLDAYSAAVAVAPLAFGGIAAADALQVTVTVTGPGNIAVTLDGIRTRYAPNL